VFVRSLEVSLILQHDFLLTLLVELPCIRILHSPVYSSCMVDFHRISVSADDIDYRPIWLKKARKMRKYLLE
jgi:hypothetical protein